MMFRTADCLFFLFLISPCKGSVRDGLDFFLFQWIGVHILFSPLYYVRFLFSYLFTLYILWHWEGPAGRGGLGRRLLIFFLGRISEICSPHHYYFFVGWWEKVAQEIPYGMGGRFFRVLSI